MSQLDLFSKQARSRLICNLVRLSLPLVTNLSKARTFLCFIKDPNFWQNFGLGAVESHASLAFCKNPLSLFGKSNLSLVAPLESNFPHESEWLSNISFFTSILHMKELIFKLCSDSAKYSQWVKYSLNSTKWNGFFSCLD